ncbi:YceI family protein [Antrihabitans stalagmiti]|nr:hypothetical protein [Antrihabitans stalagmiti]
MLPAARAYSAVAAIVGQNQMTSKRKDEQLKLRSTSRALIAGMAIVGAITMTACGSDDKSADSPTTTSAAAATTSASAGSRDANLPAQPTPEELNAQFQRALDPAVPVEEKVDQVQGAEADPALVGQFVEAARNAGATVTITKVEPLGTNELQAAGTFSINGQPGDITVDFVAEDGKWKLKKEWVCTLLTNLQQPSPACA